MDKHPNVYGEYDTIAAIRAGGSLTRFGDGELALMMGHSIPRQLSNPTLSRELQSILKSEQCLVGIPAPNPQADKMPYWESKFKHFLPLLSPRIAYYSAFISRPDWGSWLRTVEYAEAVRAIWLDKRVAVVAPRGSSILSVVGRDCAATHIDCPTFQAYMEINNLENQALDTGADLILIRAGPTATCLAHRLAPYVQAVDIGTIGAHLRRVLPREPNE